MDFDPQPVLSGPTLTLRPLTTEDREALWRVARDPLVWDQHPDQTRYARDGFERFFDGAVQAPSLAVIHNASDRVIGSSRFYEWEPERRSVAIGYTFLSREFWGGAANREMKQLMIDHALHWADTIWFHVGKGNLRSQRAMQKIGGVAAFEAQRPQNGVMIDFVYFRIDRAHWRKEA
jgi:N-acetyltransferase